MNQDILLGAVTQIIEGVPPLVASLTCRVHLHYFIYCPTHGSKRNLTGSLPSSIKNSIFDEQSGITTEVELSFDFVGKGSDAIQVKSLTVSPDPIVIPGNVNVSIDANVAEDIVAPTSLALVIKKKLFGVFIEVPCVDNLGSW